MDIVVEHRLRSTDYRRLCSMLKSAGIRYTDKMTQADRMTVYIDGVPQVSEDPQTIYNAIQGGAR